MEQRHEIRFKYILKELNRIKRDCNYMELKIFDILKKKDFSINDFQIIYDTLNNLYNQYIMIERTIGEF